MQHLVESPAQRSLYFLTLILYAVPEKSLDLLKYCQGKVCQGEMSPAPISPTVFWAGKQMVPTSPVSVGLMSYTHNSSGKDNVVKNWPLLSKSIYWGPIIITTHIWNCFAVWKALSYPLVHWILLIMLGRMCHHYPTFYRWGKWARRKLGN